MNHGTAAKTSETMPMSHGSQPLTRMSRRSMNAATPKEAMKTPHAARAAGTYSDADPFDGSLGVRSTCTRHTASSSSVPDAPATISLRPAL